MSLYFTRHDVLLVSVPLALRVLLVLGLLGILGLLRILGRAVLNEEKKSHPQTKIGRKSRGRVQIKSIFVRENGHHITKMGQILKI
jgi:hypothetical protein